MVAKSEKKESKTEVSSSSTEPGKSTNLMQESQVSVVDNHVSQMNVESQEAIEYIDLTINNRATLR